MESECLEHSTVIAFKGVGQDAYSHRQCRGKGGLRPFTGKKSCAKRSSTASWGSPTLHQAATPATNRFDI